MGRVLVQAPVAGLAIAPQMREQPKHVLHPGTRPVALAVEGRIRARELPLPGVLPEHAPVSWPQRAASAQHARTPCLRTFPAMKTCIHDSSVVRGGQRHSRAQFPNVRPDMSFHAEVPRSPLLRLLHLWISLMRRILGR